MEEKEGERKVKRKYEAEGAGSRKRKKALTFRFEFMNKRGVWTERSKNSHVGPEIFLGFKMKDKICIVKTGRFGWRNGKGKVFLPFWDGSRQVPTFPPSEPFYSGIEALTGEENARFIIFFPIFGPGELLRAGGAGKQNRESFWKTFRLSPWQGFEASPFSKTP